MVDYSKWDKFGDELSDSDEELHVPQVTRLENSSQVQIGPTGASLHPQGTASKPSAPVNSDDGAPHMNIQEGTSGSFRWRQDRGQVFIYISIGDDIKATNIQLICTDPFKSLSLTSAGEVLLQGTLKYDVQVDDGIIDWEVEQSPTLGRHVCITLTKKSPLVKTTIWWSCVFEGDEEIDVSTIAERKVTSTQQSFAESWKQAHAMFKDKVASREKFMISSEDESD